MIAKPAVLVACLLSAFMSVAWGGDLAGFRARFGSGPQVRLAPATGLATDVFGRAFDPGAAGRTDADLVTTARALFAEYRELFGVSASELMVEAVVHLDLSRIGTTDKIAVVFRQEAGDLLVRGGSAAVLFDTEGRILSVQNSTVPGALAIERVPALEPDAAMAIAQSHFGRRVEQVREHELCVVRDARGMATLAYAIELRADQRVNGAPIQERFEIDAGDGSLLRRASTVHFTDLLGNTNGWATPGVLPDQAGNSPQLFGLENVRMTCAVGNADTDADGNWVIGYAGSSSQSVTAAFGSTSKYAYVLDDSGSELALTWTVVPGIPWQFTLNPSKLGADTAEVNAQRHVNIQRDFIRAINPSDGKPNFRATAHVNIAATCNAYYDGASINFFAPGGGCVNTSYSTVVAHELGHWYNDKYGSGNGYDGFGEGAADVWAMYGDDDRYVARDFYGPGSYIRDGENHRAYCGSCGAACYGEVHADGEVLMGAMWKARRNLNATLGDAAGDLVADTLFVHWMESYNDSLICDTIENHWLTLDDNDGDIFDGTPHGDDIDSAFREQGFPGITFQHDCTAAVNFGVGTYGSYGLVPHITSRNLPQIGTSDFVLRGENTESGEAGFLLVGFTPATYFYGATGILVDLVGPHFLVPISTIGQPLPGFGYIEVPAVIPLDPSLDDLHVYAQFLFFDGGAESGLSATEGLDATICKS